ncbi:hypothetical protein NE237_007813 [Protea cynaroides]|uniref:Uncharacterized protein n=1 Tax=Protea cynaroides TaxID=273540 RepID=A0A9Q0QWU9_9MAGN|nr:hypothetical protein NE237_007813 [Protea cynaroides]
MEAFVLLRRFRSTNCSLGDNQIHATQVIEVDQYLKLKKKVTEISPELRGTSIFLVGMNSTKKNIMGKLLADALRYYYFDSDNLVEQVAGGENAANSLKERDAEGFCELEFQLMISLQKFQSNSVLC